MLKPKEITLRDIFIKRLDKQIDNLDKKLKRLAEVLKCERFFNAPENYEYLEIERKFLISVRTSRKLKQTSISSEFSKAKEQIFDFLNKEIKFYGYSFMLSSCSANQALLSSAEPPWDNYDSLATNITSSITDAFELLKLKQLFNKIIKSIEDDKNNNRN